MTSFISAPRRCLTRCSPKTQAIASATLLLPQPLGPTTLVIPSPVKMRSVWSAKDLKPVISRRLSLNIGVRHLMRGVTGIKGDFSRRQYKGRSPTCQQELEHRKFKSRKPASLMAGPSSTVSGQESRQETLRSCLPFQQDVYSAPETLGIRGFVPQHVGIQKDGW